MKRFTISLSATLLLAVTCTARADGWGSLSATFQYDGTAAPPKKENVGIEPGCKPHGVVDETWIVNKENGGVANVIIWLSTKAGDPKPAIHPDYKASETATVTLDNNKCRFEPRIAVLRTTQTLDVLNSDQFGHNTNINTLDNPGQNFIVPGGGKAKANPIKQEERLPVKVNCNIHPWMNAKIVIKDHPYVGVSDKDGKLTIKNIPAGNVTFQIYHEVYLQDVMQNGKPVKWKSGKVDVKIEDGKTFDLGTIKFKEKK